MSGLEGYSKLLKRKTDDSREALERLRRESRPLVASAEYFVSATNQLILIVAGGVAAAIVCGISTCTAQRDCIEGISKCVEQPDRGLCAFSNVVSLSGDASYSSNTSIEALTTLLRGVCSPGDRFQWSSLSNQMECIPYYPFPDALNTEIMDPGASSEHMRSCGKWIDAGGVSWALSDEVVYRSMEDHEKWLQVLENSENETTKSSRTATNQMSKFRAECMRTASAGTAAVRTSAVLAYSYLSDGVETATTKRVIRATGFRRPPL